MACIARWLRNARWSLLLVNEDDNMGEAFYAQPPPEPQSLSAPRVVRSSLNGGTPLGWGAAQGKLHPWLTA
jgi:hypothetical protein